MYKRRIKLDEAKPGMKLAEPVYVYVDPNRPSVLAARIGTYLDEGLIDTLLGYKVQIIDIVSTKPYEPIDNGDIPSDQHQHAEEKPALPPRRRVIHPMASEKADLPPEDIAPIKPVLNEELKKEAIGSIQQLFTSFSPGEVTINKTTAYQCVSNVERVVGDLVDVLSNDTTGLVHINDLKSFDEYTYHHSLSVAMLSMATGRELGLSSDDIFRLGRCAMMHDIGKQLIPLEIINKKGKLTDVEFEKVKHHTTLGASTLKINNMGDVELWEAVMCHHEKANGLGYPKGLHGKDIPLFSKIISVADVYDAVTSHRTYRDPLLPSEAFELIRKDIGISFDFDVVRAFFEKLELYPINTIVELSDGRFGIVVECDSVLRRPLRPAIRIWGTAQVEYLAAPKNVDITIIGVFRVEDFPSEA